MASATPDLRLPSQPQGITAAWPVQCPVWARERSKISPSRFLALLAECCKRQLNQGSFVLLYFRLFTFFLICIEFVFSCTVLFLSISQVIGCEDRLRNDLYCVGWGVKLYSNQTRPVPNYTAWWRGRHVWTTCPEIAMAGTRDIVTHESNAARKII